LSLGSLPELKGLSKADRKDRLRMARLGIVRGWRTYLFGFIRKARPSDRLGINIRAKAENGLGRQKRWVLRRSPVGFTTLLAEHRNDPTSEGTEEDEEE
jgi:hypothetical protein